MYAVINSGGKQLSIKEGDIINVELVDGEVGSEIILPALAIINDGKVSANKSSVEGSTVKGHVVGTTKGPKVIGFKYKSKSNQRKRWGHRQKYTSVKITEISTGKE